MTDLTEQMHKDELPVGWYYIKCDDEIFVDYYEEEIVDLETNETEKSWRNYFSVDEVLAPVPSYDEYLSLTYAKEEDGDITTSTENIVAENRTPDQMYQIMLALR